MDLPKTIRRVTVVAHDGTSTDVYRRKNGRKKKQSAPFAPGETLARRAAKGLRATADTYLDEHRDSNRDARDGWVMEVGPNLFKATRTGLRRLAGEDRD